MPTPSQAISTPHSTADISHALSTSLRQPPRVLLAAGDAALLEVPRRAERPADGARPERVEALPESGRRRILRGRDPDVVAAVVLDVEVAVAALRQRDLRQPPLVRLLLVAQLVGGVDADAADAADRDRDPDLGDGVEVTARDQVHRPDEAGVLDRAGRDR